MQLRSTTTLALKKIITSDYGIILDDAQVEALARELLRLTRVSIGVLARTRHTTARQSEGTRSSASPREK